MESTYEINIKLINLKPSSVPFNSLHITLKNIGKVILMFLYYKGCPVLKIACFRYEQQQKHLCVFICTLVTKPMKYIFDLMDIVYYIFKVLLKKCPHVLLKKCKSNIIYTIEHAFMGSVLIL